MYTSSLREYSQNNNMAQAAPATFTWQNVKSMHIPASHSRNAIVGPVRTNTVVINGSGSDTVGDLGTSTFDIQPPRGIVVGPRWVISVVVRATAGKKADGSIQPFLPTFEGPVQDPLTAMTTLSTLTINGQSNVSQTPYVSLPIVFGQTTEESRTGGVSMTPNTDDFCANFDDVQGTAGSPFHIKGAVPGRVSRGTWPYATVGASDKDEVRDYQVFMDVPNSPLSGDHDQTAPGIPNIESAQVLLNFKVGQDLADHFWSTDHKSGGFPVRDTATPNTFQVVGRPKLYLQYSTPNPQVAPIPPVVQLSYQEARLWVQNGSDGDIAAADKTTHRIESAMLSLTSYPSTIHAYVRRRTNPYGYATMATATPVAISISLGDEPSLLSGMTLPQLYMMSQAAGLTRSWNDWTTMSGGPISIPVAEFIGGPVSPGTRGSYQLKITFDYETIKFTEPFTAPELVVCVVSEGVAQIGNGTSSYMIGTMTPGEHAQVITQGTNVDHLHDVAGGGKFSRMMGRQFKRAKAWVKKASGSVSKAIKTVNETAGPLVSMVNPEAGMALGRISEGADQVSGILHNKNTAEALQEAARMAGYGEPTGGGFVGAGFVGSGGLTHAQARMLRLTGRM